MKQILDTLAQKPLGDEAEFDRQVATLEVELGELQRATRAANLPVIVIFEGWEAAGKGTLINRLAMALDPRGYRVITVQSETAQELLRPPLYRFWRDLPEPGRIALYDRSWYDRTWRALAEGELDKRELTHACDDIRAFERTLMDHGYVLIKLFLHISKDDQGRRFRKLQRDRATAWRIDASDLRQHRHYQDWRRAIGRVIDKTSVAKAPFLVIDAASRHGAALLAFREIRNVLVSRLVVPPTDAIVESEAIDTPSTSGARITSGPSLLAAVDLSQHLDDSAYVTQLQKLKDELRELEHRIYKKRIGVVVLCEGWDAAGKGGSIRRLVSALDPRGYEVIPISAPTHAEQGMHYMWRFAQRLPKGGHIAIFDRTWYGRVLVERVEGFCSERDWRLAYEEIRAFENHLVHSGNVIIKFWFQIDADEQLRRFHARQQDPEKRWKITDEDWRNREKWPLYEAAVCDMLELTGTPKCPWTVIAANDKLHARISAMQTVASAISMRLDK